MAMFLGEISFLLALAVFAAGLVLWQRGREATSGAARAAGAALLVGAVLAALCTGYWMVRYHVQGDFDHAYPQHAMGACEMMGAGGGHGGQRDMGPGMMGPGMMGPGMLGPGREPGPRPPGGGPPETTPGHQEHHPDPAAES